MSGDGRLLSLMCSDWIAARLRYPNLLTMSWYFSEADRVSVRADRQFVALLQDRFAKHKWYYGNINRVKAEKLLLASQNKDGSFLVRISESHSDEYTISARSEGKVYHFRIQRSTIGAYFVSDKISFATLGELISYYQKNPRSLGVPLDEPCAQQRELLDMEPWRDPDSATPQETGRGTLEGGSGTIEAGP
ncbi:tyrosine-protein kinase SRK3-like protein [Lates japonicus]|uniref:Tyrosine-protein kinase SRK3-like protein n=1 Tax=Lates japonicus TaxID=270547 RepID=A0AAD3QW37_LATJO|nr:tyrosine-protein kinase SRK3-like protein [Lates japonicus]